WHFIDFGLFEGPNTSAERCEKGCVTELINRLRENVAVNRCLPTDDEEGAPCAFSVDRELRFLIHFVGDIHQPLHSSTNADAGGNCVKASGFPGSHNLHQVWDTALVDEVKGSSTLEATAEALLEEFSDDVLAAGVIDPRQMAAESFALANNDIYA